MFGTPGDLNHLLSDLTYYFGNILQTIIIMSLSGSLLALILLILKPVLRHRLPKSAQYYLWLVVLVALLVPVSRLIIMPQAQSNITLAPVYTAVERISVIIEAEPNTIPNTERAAGQIIPPSGTPATETATGITTREASIKNLIMTLTILLSFAYPAIVLTILIVNVKSYMFFTKKIRRNRTRARMEELYEHVGLCGDAMPPRLYRSSIAATPMLIGIFKPEVILPDREYTFDELQSVLQHEIVHLRRRDVVIKWLSVIACALHWFNPIVWLSRREIDRTCELSCDEAVIRDLCIDGKQNYGDTLISVAADTITSRVVLSTTMCEEKEELKERLSSIMKYQQRTWITSCISTVAIIVAICSVAILGAGATAPPREANVSTPPVFKDPIPNEHTYTDNSGIFSESGFLSLDFTNSDFSNERFAEMIKNREIPHGIRILNLNYNYVTDLTPMQTLTNLTFLELTDNGISDLNGLQSLTELTHLGLAGNKISDLTPLQTLTNLTTLVLSFNEISDLTPLISLGRIDSLYLAYNNISDLSPLLSLTRIGELDIRGNPVDEAQIEELKTAFPAIRLMP